MTSRRGRATASQPMGDLMLAQALEACIRAERAQPGSSADVIAHAPVASRAELRRLMTLVAQLESSVPAIAPSPEFRTAGRARLMASIGGQTTVPQLTSLNGGAARTRAGRLRSRRWLLRGSAGLFVALLTLTATVTASASALPGDPLYGLKQAQEEVSLRLASDDQDRVLAYLRRANARLDETARLLEQGRTSEAVVTAQRYDQSVERATTTFVVTVDYGDSSGLERLESTLTAQQERLEAILQAAPEPARPDLREALATTERGRELMADPRPVERALGLRASRGASPGSDVASAATGANGAAGSNARASSNANTAVSAASAAGSPAAAQVAATRAEEEPTRVPTPRPTAIPPRPTSVAVLARHEDDDARDLARHGNDDASVQDDDEDGPQVALRPSSSGSGNGRGGALGNRGSGQGRGQDDDDSAARLARDDDGDGPGADAIVAQRGSSLGSQGSSQGPQRSGGGSSRLSGSSGGTGNANANRNGGDDTRGGGNGGNGNGNVNAQNDGGAAEGDEAAVARSSSASGANASSANGGGGGSSNGNVGGNGGRGNSDGSNGGNDNDARAGGGVSGGGNADGGGGNNEGGGGGAGRVAPVQQGAVADDRNAGRPANAPSGTSGGGQSRITAVATPTPTPTPSRRSSSGGDNRGGGGGGDNRSTDRPRGGGGDD